MQTREPFPRILIVEDQPGKISKVVEVLLNTGLVTRENLDIAQCGFDARKLLRATRYDLAILDVVLPNRPEEAPKQEGGVELLREIMTREQLYTPRYILGLTAYPEAFQEAAGEFADYTWAIVNYSENDNSWHDPIQQLIRHVARLADDQSTRLVDYDYDFCVVTALQKELDALRSIGWTWSSIRLPGDATPYFKTEVSISGRDAPAKIVAACLPRMGMVSAAVLATHMIRSFRPRIISMVGICAGVRGKVSLGDIAVADPSWDYQSGKFTGTSFEVAPHQLPLHSAIRRRVLALSGEEFSAQLRSGWRGSAPRTLLTVHVGPFASGSAVLANREKLEELKVQHRNLVAVDMEVYGIYASAAEAPIPTPYPIAIKGISDFGDEDKTEDVQDYAAYASARFFQKFVADEYSSIVPLLF